MTSDETPDAVLEGRNAGRTPERRCILSGAHGDRTSFIRLVVGPDGAAWPDLGARLPGRGAWITPDKTLLESALAKGKLKGALSRAFKQAVDVSPDLAERIADGLKKRVLERLGLEHRAGNLIFGSDKLVEWARAGRVHLIFHAGDAADDGVSRLNQALRSGDFGKAMRLPIGRDALSQALGRENIVHSGVTDGKAAARITEELVRWTAFIGSSDLIGDGGTNSGRRNDEGRE